MFFEREQYRFDLVRREDHVDRELAGQVAVGHRADNERIAVFVLDGPESPDEALRSHGADEVAPGRQAELYGRHRRFASPGVRPAPSVGVARAA
jgi:hypothetical protein